MKEGECLEGECLEGECLEGECLECDSFEYMQHMYGKQVFYCTNNCTILLYICTVIWTVFAAVG